MAAAHGTYSLLWLRVARDRVSIACRHPFDGPYEASTTIRRILLMFFFFSDSCLDLSSYFFFASYTHSSTLPVFSLFFRYQHSGAEVFKAKASRWSLFRGVGLFFLVYGSEGSCLGDEANVRSSVSLPTHFIYTQRALDRWSGSRRSHNEKQGFDPLEQIHGHAVR